MGFDDLASMEEVDVAQVWRESEPEPAQEPDDEPDEAEDVDISAARARIEDPAHMAEVDRRVQTRHAHAELGKQAEQRWREHQAGFERDALKSQIIADVGGADDYDDDDDWGEGYDDDEPAVSRVTPETVRSIDELVRSGASAEDLMEVGEVVGHEVVRQVVEHRYQQRQAELTAQQRHAQRQQDIALATPAKAAVDEFERLAGLNPHLSREAVLSQFTLLFQPNEDGVLPISLVETEEQARQIALAVWERVDQLQEGRNDEQVAAMLLRGAIAERPGDFLDRQTGELEHGKIERWMLRAGAIGVDELGPREKGRLWKRGAEGAMDAEAKRTQAHDRERAAAVKRAEAQQIRDEDERSGRRFNNPFAGT